MLLYWLKLFESTSTYVRLIIQTIYDITIFTAIFFAILASFGNAIYILNILRDVDNQLYGVTFGNSFFDSVFNQYLLAMGDWTTKKYNVDGE